MNILGGIIIIIIFKYVGNAFFLNNFSLQYNRNVYSTQVAKKIEKYSDRYSETQHKNYYKEMLDDLHNFLTYFTVMHSHLDSSQRMPMFNLFEWFFVQF